MKKIISTIALITFWLTINAATFSELAASLDKDVTLRAAQTQTMFADAQNVAAISAEWTNLCGAKTAGEFNANEIALLTWYSRSLILGAQNYAGFAKINKLQFKKQATPEIYALALADTNISEADKLALKLFMEGDEFVWALDAKTVLPHQTDKYLQRLAVIRLTKTKAENFAKYMSLCELWSGEGKFSKAYATAKELRDFYFASIQAEKILQNQ